MMHDRELTLSATDFKAQCLDIMSRIASRKIAHVTVTKRGKPIAVMGPVAHQDSDRAAAGESIPKSWGVMRGTLNLPEGASRDEFWRALNNQEMPEPDLSKFDRLSDLK